VLLFEYFELGRFGLVSLYKLIVSGLRLLVGGFLGSGLLLLVDSVDACSAHFVDCLCDFSPVIH
jgi:hypothetical protein